MDVRNDLYKSVELLLFPYSTSTFINLFGYLFGLIKVIINRLPESWFVRVAPFLMGFPNLITLGIRKKALS